MHGRVGAVSKVRHLFIARPGLAASARHFMTRFQPLVLAEHRLEDVGTQSLQGRGAVVFSRAHAFRIRQVVLHLGGRPATVGRVIYKPGLTGRHPPGARSSQRRVLLGTRFRPTNIEQREFGSA